MTQLPTAYSPAYLPRRAGLQTASLVLGIISLPTTCVCVGPVLALLAIILGAVGVSRVKRRPELYTGQGRAIGGIVTGGCSLLLAVAMLALVAQPLFTAVQVTMDLTELAAALKAYEQVHHDYPADLATLAAANLARSNPRSPSSRPQPFPSVKYISDIHPSDPPNWILAHRPFSFGPFQFSAVLYADLRGDALDPEKFTAAMAQFRREYEAARGQPPEIPATGEAP